MSDPYFSEVRYQASANTDFLEVAVAPDAPVDDLVVTLYNDDGTVIATFALDGLTPIRIGGRDVYVINRTAFPSFPDLSGGDGVSLSDATTVYQFLSYGNTSSFTAVEGPASGLTSSTVPNTGGNASVVSSDGGGTYTSTTDITQGAVPCLTIGTSIQTPDGPVKIEDLRRGMFVTTAQGASNLLRAIFSRTIQKPELVNNPKLYPVRVTAGALGKGLPKTDVLVSRQHRFLATSPIVRRMFDVPEVLIAAIKLTELPGIYVDTSVTSVTYFHLLFDAHEVIFAEGAPTESLFLGAEAIKTLPCALLAEIAAIFPTILDETSTMSSFCTIPTGAEQKHCVARHAANHKPLLDQFSPLSA
jgi:hypothetical protein